MQFRVPSVSYSAHPDRVYRIGNRRQRRRVPAHDGIEHCENVVRILFLSSGLFDKPQYLELITTTETESAEIYAGIENAMNPINQSDETKLA